jgi:hypothetical protein
MMMMPAGFRFQPTDEELVGFYLLNKVRGKIWVRMASESLIFMVRRLLAILW